MQPFSSDDKELWKYFLAVINGEVSNMHPRRQKLAGSKEGELCYLLLGVQYELLRASMVVEKPLSCSASLLSKIAKLKPRSLNEMSKIIGSLKTGRFCVAFWMFLMKLYSSPLLIRKTIY